MAQCPICLESFKEDEALIPDLPCNCALIVHLDCWTPWSGSCLYCREEVQEFQHVVEPQLQQAQPNIVYYNPADVLCIIVACFVIYFYIIIHFT
jgi:hypothetical protein